MRLERGELLDFLGYNLEDKNARKIVLTAISHPQKPKIAVMSWTGAYTIVLDPATVPPEALGTLAKCSAPAKGDFQINRSFDDASPSKEVSYHLDLYPPESYYVVQKVVYLIMTELYGQKPRHYIGFDYEF